MMDFLFYLTIVLFILVCLFMILLILIQKGRGGGLASAFGGRGRQHRVRVEDRRRAHVGDQHRLRHLPGARRRAEPLRQLAARAVETLADESGHRPFRRRFQYHSARFDPAGDAVEKYLRPLRPAPRMIVSMTGFGDAAAERDGTHYSVEIRISTA